MRKYLPFLVPVASIVLGFGVSISGIVSLPVAIILWSFGGLFLAIYGIYKLSSRTTQMVEQEDVESTDIYPSTLDDIHWIANEEFHAYKDDYDRMPFELLKQWYIKNPKSFWIIRDKSGVRIGNLYI